MTTTQAPPQTGVIGAEELERAADTVGAITAAYGSRIVGQERLRTALLVTLMAEGHVLLESVPGLAKTLAASTLAHAVGGAFTRIQCTPDLLPSDIVGTQVYDPRRHEFETQLGPVHAHVVLLDEINRASAKTQSAMLEAMQERQTSIAGVVHPLPQPFLVLATQNPVDEEGTYVLPHAQLDRFLLKEVVDYPAETEELEVLDRLDAGRLGPGLPDVEPAVALDQVRWLQGLTRRVYVDPAIRRYVVALVRATRATAQVLGSELGGAVELGASPRGAIAFFQAARALAVLRGRNHVIPEDVRDLRYPVLRHRLLLSFEAQAQRIRPETVIDAVVSRVPTP